MDSQTREPSTVITPAKSGKERRCVSGSLRLGGAVNKAVSHQRAAEASRYYKELETKRTRTIKFKGRRRCPVRHPLMGSVPAAAPGRRGPATAAGVFVHNHPDTQTCTR